LRHRWILSATAFGLSVVLAEMLLPLVPPRLGTMQRIVHHVDQSGNYYLRPNSEVEFDGMFERISPAVTWQINDQGLRGDHHVDVPSTKFRIATYGDSETFGWSVSLDDTFQRRMERIDPRVEVLNLGIPGYNAENVADRMEATVDTVAPDLLVYLANKNDVDLPNDIRDSVLSSELLLRMRFLWQVVLTKPWRLERRRSPERLAFMASQLDRIASLASGRGIPVRVVFLKTRTWQGAVGQAKPGGFVAAAASTRTAASTPTPADSVRVVLAEDWLGNFPRLDDHLPAEAHAVLAGRLCEDLSQGLPQSCLPPGWSVSARSRHVLPVAASAVPAPVLAAATHEPLIATVWGIAPRAGSAGSAGSE
jgi:hypothetical protein